MQYDSAQQPSRQLSISDAPCEGFSFEPEQLQRCFDFLDTLPVHSIEAGELSLVFLSDEDLAQMHGEYCGDPAPTDVITFDGDPEMDFAGEIFVSIDRALEEAPKHGNTFAEELTLYLIHGWLHLSGLDDIEETDREQMRAGEREVMAALRAAALIPVFSYTPAAPSASAPSASEASAEGE